MKSFFALPVLLLTFFASAQKPLRVGDTLPGWTFRSLTGAATPVHLKPGAGKALLIEFWSLGCGTSTARLPVLASQQKKFSKDLTILTVSDNDPGYTRDFLQQRKRLVALGLPLLERDSAFVRHFPHQIVPLAVLVGHDGRIKAITEGTNVTEQHLERLIEGRDLHLPEQTVRLKIDDYQPLVTTGLVTKSNLLTQSIITGAIKGLSPGQGFRKLGGGQLKVFCNNSSLLGLFLFAWSPRVRLGDDDIPTRVIVKVKDSIKFFVSPDGGASAPNLYCYEGIVPTQHYSNWEALAFMRSDLDRFFGLQSRVERRKTKCYIVSAKDTAGRPEGGKIYLQEWLQSVELENMPVEGVAGSLQQYILKDYPLIVREAGDKRFTIELKKKYGSLLELQAHLNKAGLKVSVEEQELDFLVIEEKD